MHLAIDGRALTDRPSGIGRYVSELVRALSKLGDRQPRQTIFLPRENWNSTAVRELSGCAGVRFAETSWRASGWGGVWWDQNGLPALAGEIHADLLFIPHINVPLRSPMKTILVFHDASIYEAPAGFGWRSRMYYRAILRAGVSRMTRVVTVSQWSRAAILRHFPKLDGKLEVIYPGIAPDFFNVTREQAQCAVEREFSIRAPYVLYTGGVGARKNLARSLAAFAGMASHTKLPHLLVMTGSTGKNGFGSRIKHLGHVNDRTLANLYAAADLCLYPSLYEGFGFPVLEAMAVGTPVVTSAGSPMQEVAGAAARYVDPSSVSEIESAIIAALGDAARGRTSRDDGRRRAREFSWDSCANQVQRLAVECLSHPS